MTVTGPKPPPIIEHYHLVFNDYPDFTRFYMTQRQAYERVKEFGEKAEPNVEWYEEGPVMVETRLPGRTGLHRMLIEVGICHRITCMGVPRAAPRDE